MRYPETSRGRARNTVCVSSQVGCAVGCPFCATGRLGLKRHLKADEIVAQILYFARFIRETDGPEARITNVVFMGEGEPLANFRHVWRAVEILNDPDAVGLGARRVTISTSGLVPRIQELADKSLQVGLAISLHAPTDELRDRLVPVNRKYPIAALLDACRSYAASTGCRVSFEYAMMRDVNDSLDQAALLASHLEAFPSHVNLIPLNHVDGSPFEPTPRRQIDAFQGVLRQRGVSCTVRSTRGDDIDGACGQLKAADQGDGLVSRTVVAAVPTGAWNPV
jgi:23S rRNA (adenine2503-C2)-methyltransferase